LKNLIGVEPSTRMKIQANQKDKSAKIKEGLEPQDFSLHD